MARIAHYFDATPYEALPLNADQRALLNALKSAPYNADLAFKTTHARTLAGAFISGKGFSPLSVAAAVSRFRGEFKQDTTRETITRLYAGYNAGKTRKPSKRSHITEDDLVQAERNGVKPLLELLMTVPLGPGKTIHDKDVRGGFLIICKAIAAAQAPKNARRLDHHWNRFTGLIAGSPKAIQILDVFNDAVNDNRITPRQFGFKLPLAMTGSLALAIEAKLKR